LLGKGVVGTKLFLREFREVTTDNTVATPAHISEDQHLVSDVGQRVSFRLSLVLPWGGHTEYPGFSLEPTCSDGPWLNIFRGFFDL
jgi:hypothetical protein